MNLEDRRKAYKGILSSSFISLEPMYFNLNEKVVEVAVNYSILIAKLLPQGQQIPENGKLFGQSNQEKALEMLSKPLTHVTTWENIFKAVDLENYGKCPLCEGSGLRTHMLEIETGEDWEGWNEKLSPCVRVVRIGNIAFDVNLLLPVLFHLKIHDSLSLESIVYAGIPDQPATKGGKVAPGICFIFGEYAVWIAQRVATDEEREVLPDFGIDAHLKPIFDIDPEPLYPLGQLAESTNG